MPTAGRSPPGTSPKIPLPTAGTRPALSPAKRPAPAPSPARPVPTPTTAHDARPAPASDRETAIPGETPQDHGEVWPKHEAPTAGGSDAPPPIRAAMPTPTEVFSTVVPREAFADHDDEEDHGHRHDDEEEPSPADDGPTAAAMFDKLEPRPPTHHTPSLSRASAPGLASAPVWLVRHDGHLQVVVANGARPEGAIDAVIVASAADLASALHRLRAHPSGGGGGAIAIRLRPPGYW